MFGGDPEELMRGLREFAAQQAETVAEAQREQFATLTLNTAVELTGAALKRMEVSGTTDEQALALRDAMRILFPEAVALVTLPARDSCASTRLSGVVDRAIVRLLPAIPKPIVRRISDRYIAGSTLEDACRVVSG